MQSLIIRLAVSVMFALVIVLWYAIPDHFFVNYSQAYIFEGQEEGHETVVDKEQVETTPTQEHVKDDASDDKIVSSIKQSVPFVVQAPHAQWNDPRYQDACEEASMIMVDAWIKGERNISKNDAEDMMEAIFEREKEMFGDSIDTSSSDTARFIRDYYGYDVEVRENVVMEDLYDILSEEHVIIAPTNGKMLENPHFTNGGPDRHMLVIIGFDRDNREFVTNDPGTRVGRGYKYKDTTLYNAIRDYETGVKKEISGTKKNVIIVKK